MANSRKGRPPIFGLLLVAVGLVLLLQNLEVVSWTLWPELWRFWPLLLVSVGVNLIIGRRFPIIATAIIAALVAVAFVGAATYAEREDDTIVVDTFSEPLGDTTELNFRVAYGLGRLEIDSLSSVSSSLAEGVFETECRGAATSLEKHGGTASINVEADARAVLCQWNSDWKMSLSQVPQTTIEVSSGASSIELDLTDLKVINLDVSVGAASVEITMPANAGHVDAHISAGVSSIDVRIPEGVEARIVRDSGLSSFDVSSRFPSVASRVPEDRRDDTIGGRDLGDIFESAGYRDAANRIDIEFDVGVSSVNVH